MSKVKNTYSVEITDTFAGEANYSWVKRFKVEAESMRGAIGIVSRQTGYKFKIDHFDGYSSRYNAKNASVCCFIEYSEGE